MVYGQNVTPPVVNKLVPGAAAEQSGMRPGDRVIAIDGRQIERFEQVSQAIFYRPDENADFTIERGSETVHLSIKIGIRKERSEEHTSELQSLMRISYAVFCLKKKKKKSD